MAILSIASAKGGCGKTTMSTVLGSVLAHRGYEVRLLDCDLNQHASAFGTKSKLEKLTVCPSIDEHNILRALREAEDKAELTIIDLPGGSSTLALKALQRSNFVLVPCQASLPDVRDAMKTIAQIEDAEDLARAPIARSLIWSRVLPGFESRAAKHVRESVEAQGVPIFATGLMERAAFREMHITGQSPSEQAPSSAAATNAEAITDELLVALGRLLEQAA
ncbi:ParA family protein [Asaia bogorensis]|uniref:Chromosome partitioning protein ParA n=1 Tax=Asaia bogorensis NBRC 16594 TaxID=1231624 RepID=A0AAN4U3U3_9PROT|nr:ParA family protein [Asaia bogorensis]GEL54913.1 chromosome partitioning protein ParA [Asaia bogorensis NBRC 16594]